MKHIYTQMKEYIYKKKPLCFLLILSHFISGKKQKGLMGRDDNSTK